MILRARVEPLAWESQFFGLQSAIVRIDDSAPPLTAETLAGQARVQAKIPADRADFLDALQQLGFRLVEGEVDLALAVTPVAPVIAEVATGADIPALRDMAARAFALSRFRAPWYSPQDSGRFYAQWIENAVRGTFDHQCLLLRAASGDIRGYVSLRELNDTNARIGLLAGRGAGAELMQAALNWAQARGKKTVRVATQMGNTAALKRYIQSGANVESTAFWLYR
ncbi:dTDP-4-amino-4,6-dideoxy-D-galactose acyltransferase [Superficieibacter electus]|uniref:dTDP-fucosamine acetyltransferase n=1 Tax=Superficieibacter electus TaxID=2022662 RepID=A0A2P5GL88_9ENTR|nr:dTDP-4-amino-4,6-dideoxy-D-galactose acyltransferase [Superficieibacter electus]POP42682.1 dTDP-4-amino-4,6-dideoxy-D-galactose acyltransferase [Superficieibacter electus]POP45758.1 dTDP-4-amino-4,6-dideoxy-D-galactose acyltransferase [Superficieibacter electus]